MAKTKFEQGAVFALCLAAGCSRTPGGAEGRSPADAGQKPSTPPSASAPSGPSTASSAPADSDVSKCGAGDQVACAAAQARVSRAEHLAAVLEKRLVEARKLCNFDRYLANKRNTVDPESLLDFDACLLVAEASDPARTKEIYTVLCTRKPSSRYANDSEQMEVMPEGANEQNLAGMEACKRLDAVRKKP